MHSKHPDPSNFAHKSIDGPTLSEEQFINLTLADGDACYQRGRYNESYEKYKKAFNLVSISKNSLNPLCIAKVNHKLGIAALKKANFKEAGDYFLHALEKSSGKDMLTTCMIMSSMGKVHLAQANYPEALICFQKTLDTLLETFPNEHAQIIGCYNNLADLNDVKGKYHESLGLLEKTINFARENNIINSFELATTYYLTGRVYESLAIYEKASYYANEALRRRQELYGPDHPELALCYGTIGHIHFDQSKYTEALEYYNKTLDIRLRFLGELHPYVANSHANIGMTLKTLSKYAQALDQHEKALKIRKAFFGENHPEIANSYTNIANVNFHQGEYNKALENYTHALKMHLLFNNEDHPSVASDYESIGNVCKKLHDYKRAEENLIKARDIKLKLYGSKHPEVANLFNCLGALYHDQNEYAKAFPNYVNTIRSELAIFESKHFKEAHTYYNLSLMFKKNKDLALAEMYGKKARMIYWKNFGKTNIDTVEAKMQIKSVEQRGCRVNLNNDFDV